MSSKGGLADLAAANQLNLRETSIEIVPECSFGWPCYTVAI